MLRCLVCGKRPVRQSLLDELGQASSVTYGTCQPCSGDPHAAGCNDLGSHQMPAGCSRDSRRQRKPAQAVKVGVLEPFSLEVPVPIRLRAVPRARLYVELERFVDRMLMRPARRQQVQFDARLIGQSADGSLLYDADIVCGESK